MTLEKQIKTIGFYDANAQVWAETHGGIGNGSYWQEELKKFHELLPTGKILEIGSGAGNEAKLLIQSGYEYTGVDASKGLIEVAQRNNPDAEFVNVEVDKMNFPEKFDGFWAAAMLLHIPKENIDGALQSIKNQIKKGGVGFISLKEGEGEEVHEKTGRWFSYYRSSEFSEILKRNGFEIVDLEFRVDDPKLTWLGFFVRV